MTYLGIYCATCKTDVLKTARGICHWCGYPFKAPRFADSAEPAEPKASSEPVGAAA